MKTYINRSGYMAQAQDYALKVFVDHQLEEVTAIFATPLRVTENQVAVLTIKDKEYFELDRLDCQNARTPTDSKLGRPSSFQLFV